jgi:hypothetical protein
VADSFGYGNELPGSTNGRKFFGQLIEHQLLKTTLLHGVDYRFDNQLLMSNSH